MNKAILSFLMLLVTSPAWLGAETVLVAPLIVYDKESNVIELERNPSELIFDDITGRWLEGLISFRKVPNQKYGPVYTTLDANRCCAAEGAEYILFGFVQKNEGSWACHVKLFDSGSKKVVKEFYSSDDSGHYGRMLSYMSANIAEGLEEATGLSGGKYLKEKERPFELRLVTSGFYWTPVDAAWRGKLMGIAGGTLGAELFPPQPKITLGPFLVDFSLRPQFSYSYARKKEGGYPMRYDGIAFSLPVSAHFRPSLRNTIYLGTGIYYEFEFLKITPKYADEESHLQNLFGVESFLGYEFSAGRTVSIFGEVCADFHFKDDGFVAIRPVLGLSFNLYRGNM